jgi:hypothetical protein
LEDIYRMRISALNVESAQIEGQFNRNIPSGIMIEALAKSVAMEYGSGSQAVVTPAASRSAPIEKRAKEHYPRAV